MITYKKIFTLKSLLLISSISITPMAFADSFGEQLYNKFVAPWEQAGTMTQRAVEKKLAGPQPQPGRQDPVQRAPRVYPEKKPSEPTPPPEVTPSPKPPEATPSITETTTTIQGNVDRNLPQRTKSPVIKIEETTITPVTEDRRMTTPGRMKIQQKEGPAIRLEETTTTVIPVQERKLSTPAVPQQRVGTVGTQPRGRIQAAPRVVNVRYRERVIRGTSYQRTPKVTRVKSSPLNSPLRIKLEKMKTS